MLNRSHVIPCLLASVALLTVSHGVAVAGEANAAERNSWYADTRAAIPRMAKAPTIDGKIEPGEWDGAAQFGAQFDQGSRQFYGRVVIWHLGWDDENLYLASRTLLRHERPKRLARTGVGTSVMFDDTLEMWIDPKGRNAGKELASYFQSMVNSLGITYYARLYPSVGAKTEDWKPAWKIESSFDANVLDFEIRMPVKDFGIAGTNKPGDAWGMMLARNFMDREWNQSSLAFAMAGFGFAVNGPYPLMTLTEDRPHALFRSPLGLFEGRACADLKLVNPSAKARKVHVELALATAPRDANAARTLFQAAKDLDVPPGGQAAFKIDEPANPPIDANISTLYSYRLTAVDNGTEVFHTHFPFDPNHRQKAWLARPMAPPPDLRAGATFNPVRGLLQSDVNVIDFPKAKDVVGARTIVLDESNKVLADASTDKGYRFNYTNLMKLPPLTPGTYKWQAFAVLADKSLAPAGDGNFAKRNEANDFPWWNTKVGDAEKVLWPYEPVKVELDGAVVKAWGKEYRLDGLALPTQILSTGNADRWPKGRSSAPEVLAEPVRLEATIGGNAVKFEATGKPRVISKADHRVVLGGRAEAQGLAVVTSARFEQDGSLFIDLTLQPATQSAPPVKVDSLDLVIPVRIEVATFINAYAHCGYSGYFIDALPAKAAPGRPTPTSTPGVPVTVWTAALNGAPSVTVGNFIPQIWLGNEFRGLLWYADSDQGWTPVDGKDSQEVNRTDKAAIMVHHIISVPTEISAPRTIRFVLQATPIRPLQPGWRMLNTDPAQSFLNWNAMGRNAAAYSAVVNLKDDAAYEKSMSYSKGFPGPKGNPPNTARFFAPHTETTIPLTSIRADNAYFAGDWMPCTYSKTMNDQALWYIQKWITAGGLQGLYHDQFSPHKTTSLTSGAAYLLPDGRVQPAFALTTRRDFVMREHALWLENGVNPPRTLTHATNGGPMAAFGWVESCLDGEDKMINKNAGIDYADTWPSIRIRAGSISYNTGTTFSWMRLIDATGMSKEEQAAHRRVFIGHCMMHDVIDPFGWDSGRAPLLLAWGLNDDQAMFWPHWSNADAVKLDSNDVKVSAWTLSDRVLLCVFNYSKEKDADCQITLDLKTLGVKLPDGASAFNLEKPDQAVETNIAADKATLKFTAPKRDYMLISLSPKLDVPKK